MRYGLKNIGLLGAGIIAAIMATGAASCSDGGTMTHGSPLLGTYVPEQAPPDTAFSPSAGWSLTFNDTSYAFHRDTILTFEGQYRTAGDTLTVSGEVGLPWIVCSDSLGGRGIYVWSRAGEHLQFQAVDDPCERRRTQLEMSPYVPGTSPPPPMVSVPDSLFDARNTYFGRTNVIGDSLVPALATLVDDDSEFMGVRGRDAILDFAADFFCATGRRMPGTPSYERFGPCSGRFQETVHWRPFLFAQPDDRLIERGAYILRLFSDGDLIAQGVGRYEVVWTRTQQGRWRIVRLMVD